MGTNIPKVQLPKPSKKGPSIKFQDPVEELLKRYDRQTNIIIAVFLVAFITMIIMTSTLIVDSFHINSTTYKEYSGKTETHNVLLETNKQNQEVIKQNQEEIKKLLQSK